MSSPTSCQLRNTASREFPPIAQLAAQRMWLLRRGCPGSDERFAGGVLVAADEGVYGIVVVSPDPACASEQALLVPRVRCQLYRNARKWLTLDAALVGSDEMKHTLKSRGWFETTEHLQ